MGARTKEQTYDVCTCSVTSFQIGILLMQATNYFAFSHKWWCAVYDWNVCTDIQLSMYFHSFDLQHDNVCPP